MLSQKCSWSVVQSRRDWHCILIHKNNTQTNAPQQQTKTHLNILMALTTIQLLFRERFLDLLCAPVSQVRPCHPIHQHECASQQSVQAADVEIAHRRQADHVRHRLTGSVQHSASAIENCCVNVWFLLVFRTSKKRPRRWTRSALPRRCHRTFHPDGHEIKTRLNSKAQEL